MKLKDAFISKRIQNDVIVVSTEKDIFNGIVNANESAGFIIECLKADTTREEIIEKMIKKYDASVEIITADVDKVIESLRGINAIDE